MKIDDLGVGYKVDLAGGRTGYVDGYFDLPSHSVVLSKKRGAHLTNYSWSPVSLSACCVRVYS